jgi:hypothetical protein
VSTRTLPLVAVGFMAMVGLSAANAETTDHGRRGRADSKQAASRTTPAFAAGPVCVPSGDTGLDSGSGRAGRHMYGNIFYPPGGASAVGARALAYDAGGNGFERNVSSNEPDGHNDSPPDGRGSQSPDPPAAGADPPKHEPPPPGKGKIEDPPDPPSGGRGRGGDSAGGNSTGDSSGGSHSGGSSSGGASSGGAASSSPPALDSGAVFSTRTPSANPEPASLLLIGTSLGGMALARRRLANRKRR